MRSFESTSVQQPGRISRLYRTVRALYESLIHPLGLAKCSTIALLATAMLGPPLRAGAPVPAETDGRFNQDVEVEDALVQPIQRAISTDSTQAGVSNGISITPSNQILVEWAPEDTGAANLFDLSGKTVLFTPDGQGGYSRSVGPVAWVNDIGSAVENDAEIQLQTFTFKFAGRDWGSFFVSQRGLITFGEPLTYSQLLFNTRWAGMSEIASKFVTTPTISPLFKPKSRGPRHVALQRDRVVVTWSTTARQERVHGVPPTVSSRFQVVLMADGRIKFNYADIVLRDGIVGLFFDEELTNGKLVASFTDPVDSELPGHLDLLGVAIYESNKDALIVEWTMRDGIPTPPSGTTFRYRLLVDMDTPYFDGSGRDIEVELSVAVRLDKSSTRGGERLPTSSPSRISLLVEDTAVRGIVAGIRFSALQFDKDGYVQGDRIRPSLAEITLPNLAPTTDLSRSSLGFSKRQSEVFRYRSRPSTREIACRVINALGDEFDVFVFHSEFRVDVQEHLTPVTASYGNTRAAGTGKSVDSNVPCGEGRMKAVWAFPVWMKYSSVLDSRRPPNRRFDRGLNLFAHEFTHVWTAKASYLRNGDREPLFGSGSCQCHWRKDLHLPTAFPWHSNESAPHSVMGGAYWRESSGGRFTRFSTYWDGDRGHSWLDLYMMGLAAASEVPDMFILRNLRPVDETDPDGPHYGEKEVVTIQQVVAAEGRRIPSVEHAQKDFNAAFVYLLDPGRTPDTDMLRLHAEYRDKVIEHWWHVTGGRSRLTTSVPVLTDPPATVQ